MSSTENFTEEQQQYLAGFVTGSGLAAGLAPGASGDGAGAAPAGGSKAWEDYPLPERLHLEAQDRVLAAGGKLCKEEKAKRERHPLDRWDELAARAERDAYPKGMDVFITKFQGLFYVAPAQESYMCRLRLPGGRLSGHQFRAVAELAGKHGGGYTHVTTRANLQVRQITPRHALPLLTGLQEAGIVTRGSGADNIRNITASPTAGYDPQEMIDTTDLARRMHHYILNHREMYGLPRKFNIAFDGGGTISALADTNDIGFAAVRVAEIGGTNDSGTNDSGAGDPSGAGVSPVNVEPGVYFRLQLGGITGHKDFARDTGVMLRPEQCVPVAAAIVRVFIAHGDRTNRNKARLKYLLDDWGFETFLEEVEREYGEPLPRFPLDQCERPRPPRPDAHIGVHPQKQSDRYYVGVALPVGRLEAEQMRRLADIADRFGAGELRLTVWQNVILPGIHEDDLAAVKGALDEAGLTCSATSIRAGLIACTGNGGCKFAASDTKGHAMDIAAYLESRIDLDTPLNIHLTGCHHSCAQHYIGDIGLLATKVERGEEMVEGYHLYVGGGFGEDAQIARELITAIPHDALPERIERLLLAYRSHRVDASETFQAFTRRHGREDLLRMMEQASAPA